MYDKNIDMVDTGSVNLHKCYVFSVAALRSQFGWYINHHLVFSYKVYGIMTNISYIHTPLLTKLLITEAENKTYTLTPIPPTP